MTRYQAIVGALAAAAVGGQAVHWFMRRQLRGSVPRVVPPAWPEATPGLVQEFTDQCARARDAWLTHRTLFDDNPKAELHRRVGAYDAFLDRLSVITQEYALLQIARLHDPPFHGKRVNLSLELLVNARGWDSGTRERLCGLKKRLDGFNSHIVKARDRILAHADHHTIREGKALGAFSAGSDLTYFRVLEEFVSALHQGAEGRPYEFGDFARTDAEAFLATLDRGEI